MAYNTIHLSIFVIKDTYAASGLSFTIVTLTDPKALRRAAVVRCSCRCSIHFIHCLATSLDARLDRGQIV